MRRASEPTKEQMRLIRRANALLSASMTPEEREASEARHKRNEKRERRYNRGLARNQWSVTK